MDLTPMEIRILGSLVEKEFTTPDNYPLSTHALVAACNQKSNRDPVVEYAERDVDTVVLELRAGRKLARTITGGRANKHRHILDEAWGLDRRALAVLAVLMLRGPQTPGELRTRTERMVDFADLDEIEAVLTGLAARDEPFVVHLERVPGQKERRWAHLLDDDVSDGRSRVWAPAAAGAPPGPESSEDAHDAIPDHTDDLRGEVARLRADVDRLYELLGERPGGPE